MPDQTEAPAATEATEDQAPSQTPTKPPAKATPPEPDPDAVSAQVWALGNHRRQVQLAGLLVDQPDLETAQMTPADWQQRLDQYARSERI